MSTSVERGRCGPCCSIAAIGRMATGSRPASVAISSLVDSCHFIRRRPPTWGADGRTGRPRRTGLPPTRATRGCCPPTATDSRGSCAPRPGSHCTRTARGTRDDPRTRERRRACPDTNSTETAAMGRDRPASTSASWPSTSILQNRGSPCSSMSASSVVTRTSSARSHRTRRNVGFSRATVSLQPSASVDSVGFRSLTASFAIPSSRPTARGTMVTPGRRPTSRRSHGSRAGWGSSATTRAPRARERGRPVTQVRADVEDEIPRLDERRIQGAEPALAPGSPVDEQRPRDPPRARH